MCSQQGHNQCTVDKHYNITLVMPERPLTTLDFSFSKRQLWGALKSPQWLVTHVQVVLHMLIMFREA